MPILTVLRKCTNYKINAMRPTTTKTKMEIMKLLRVVMNQFPKLYAKLITVRRVAFVDWHSQILFEIAVKFMSTKKKRRRNRIKKFSHLKRLVYYLF